MFIGMINLPLHELYDMYVTCTQDCHMFWKMGTISTFEMQSHLLNFFLICM